MNMHENTQAQRQTQHNRETHGTTQPTNHGNARTSTEKTMTNKEHKEHKENNEHQEANTIQPNSQTTNDKHRKHGTAMNTYDKQGTNQPISGLLRPLGIETGCGDTIKWNWSLGPLGPCGPWGSRQGAVKLSSETRV